MGCSSLLLYLENELDNAEGKADTVTLMCTGVVLFRGCAERAPSRRWVWVGYRAGVWGTGQKQCEYHDFTLTDHPTQMFWSPDGVTEIRQSYFPSIRKKKILVFLLHKTKPNFWKAFFAQWQTYFLQSSGKVTFRLISVLSPEQSRSCSTGTDLNKIQAKPVSFTLFWTLAQGMLCSPLRSLNGILVQMASTSIKEVLSLGRLKHLCLHMKSYPVILHRH